MEYSIKEKRIRIIKALREENSLDEAHKTFGSVSTWSDKEIEAFYPYIENIGNSQPIQVKVQAPPAKPGAPKLKMSEQPISLKPIRVKANFAYGKEYSTAQITRAANFRKQLTNLKP